MEVFERKNQYKYLKEAISKTKTKEDLNKLKNEIRENFIYLDNIQLKDLVEYFNLKGGNLNLEEELKLKEEILDYDSDDISFFDNDEEYVDIDDDEEFIGEENNNETCNGPIAKVTNVEYSYTYDDINYDEFEAYEGNEEEYIEEQKEKIKEELGTEFEIPLCDMEEGQDIEDYISEYIADETGYVVESFDYEVEFNSEEEVDESCNEAYTDFYGIHDIHIDVEDFKKDSGKAHDDLIALLKYLNGNGINERCSIDDMQAKCWGVKDGDILYWVTQSAKPNAKVRNLFKKALKDTHFKKVFLILRDDSCYNYEADVASGKGKFVDINESLKEDVEIDSQMETPRNNKYKVDNYFYIEDDCFMPIKGISKIEKSKITEVNIPDGVKCLGSHLFYECENLTKVTIPTSVIKICSHAFTKCKSLKNIVIPDSVNYIGMYIFSGCENLTNIVIPDSVTKMGHGVFAWCPNLTKVKLSNNIKSIPHCTFTECVNLKDITIPNSVVNIDDDAFSECKSLTNVTLPNSVKKIDLNAFSNCINLKNINIPNNLKVIGYGAFYNCNNLTSITLPNSVEDISFTAFNNCKNITIKTNNPYVIDYCEENDIKYEGLNESLNEYYANDNDEEEQQIQRIVGDIWSKYSDMPRRSIYELVNLLWDNISGSGYNSKMHNFDKKIQEMAEDMIVDNLMDDWIDTLSDEYLPKGWQKLFECNLKEDLSDKKVYEPGDEIDCYEIAEKWLPAYIKVGQEKAQEYWGEEAKCYDAAISLDKQEVIFFGVEDGEHFIFREKANEIRPKMINIYYAELINNSPKIKYNENYNNSKEGENK